MLMPRIPYHLTNGYSPNMSIAVNMQHQQQHISQLLNTAATGTGIVGDVDALLTPIHIANNNPTPPPPPPQRSDIVRERNLWRTNEIMEVLKIMQEINAIDMLNVKTVKSELIFRKVERIMFSRGFRKKSHVQIWTKWKFLKSTYSTSRRSGIIPKMIPQLIYDELHKMLQNNNNNTSSSSGRGSVSNCGNSMTSLDGDNSNLDMANSSGGSGVGNDSQLVISGVEGGYDGSKSSLDGGAGGDGESDEENGLAHPIFGFRLGLVKQEPTDTGYEPPTKPKQKDTTDNLQFQTEIKQEVNDGSDSPVAARTPPVEDTPQTKRQSAPEIMILSRRVAPPASTNSTSPTTPANATSTPNGPTSTAQTRSGSSANTTPGSSQLPPLRIAPFAKVPPNESTSAPISAATLPPPPLAMNPTTNSSLRLNSAYSSNAYAMADKRNAAMSARNGSTPPTMLNYQRRLISNQIHKPQSSQTVTVSTRLPPVLEPSYMRRQEMVVPDLDATPAPHEYQSSQPFYGFPDGPSTSQQAQQQLMENRKRRLGVTSHMSSNPMPPKRMAPRQTEQFTNRLTPRQAALEFGGGDDFEDQDYQNDNATHTTQRAQTTNETATNNPMDQHNRDQTHSRVLQDMAFALRQMQREVINDFFKRQMKFAREEHEFQRQQDELLMQAFKEQALQFQHMSKQLLGSAVKIEKRKKRLEKQARKQMLNEEIKQVRQMQTQLGGKKALKKELANGMGAKAKLEQNKETDEDDTDGIHFLMGNVHAQLDLSEADDDDDADAEGSNAPPPNHYEYDINEYSTSQDYAGAELMEQESADAIDAQEAGTNDAAEDESDEGSEDVSENMEIIGH